VAVLSTPVDATVVSDRLVDLLETIGIELALADLASVAGPGSGSLLLVLAGWSAGFSGKDRLAALRASFPSVEVVHDGRAVHHRLFDVGPFRLGDLCQAAAESEPLACLCRLGTGAEESVYGQLARRHGVRFVALTGRHPLAVPPTLAPSQVTLLRAVDVRVDGEAVKMVAPPLDRLPELLPRLAMRFSGDTRFCLTTPRRLEKRLRASLAERTERATTSHIDAHLPEFSSRRTPSLIQKAGIVLASLLFAVGTLLPIPVATAAVTFASVAAFLGLTLVRLGGCTAAWRPSIAEKRLADADLPSYALLVALYQEANMLPQLSAALDRLDYPRDRLDIVFLVEEDDLPTRTAADAAVEGRPHMRVTVVPAGRPRTKPRALAYGLAFCRASIVAVFDAEDRPHPDQLRVAAAALVNGPSDLACVQARLDIAGARSWLERQFLIEYASLFSGVLPWLSRERLPLPLGGTSNHFKRRVLAAVGGWDPYNVTEDADLGVRLARFGYRTAVIDSSTLETAPETVAIWLRQRRRWVKGWLMTALVHAARPARLVGDVGLRATTVVLLHLAANVLAPLLYPVWMATVLFYLFGILDPPVGGGLFGNLLLGAMVASLLVGYFSTFLCAWLALDRRGRPDIRLDLPLMPIYWLLGAWAAWRAVAEVLVSPHFWAKTPHLPAPHEPDLPAGRSIGWRWRHVRRIVADRLSSR